MKIGYARVSTDELTRGEFEDLLAALVNARDWQESLAQAWGEGTHERITALKMAARYTHLRIKLEGA